MKKIILLMVIVVTTLSSCTSNKYIMSVDEITEKGYATNNWEITKNGEVLAKVTSHEYELYNNKLVKEISITLSSIAQTEDINDIIRFIHTKVKIEVNYDALIKYE